MGDHDRVVRSIVDAESLVRQLGNTQRKGIAKGLLVAIANKVSVSCRRAGLDEKAVRPAQLASEPVFATCIPSMLLTLRIAPR